MKAIAAIFCSLMLIGTMFRAAQVPAACAMPMSHACCHGDVKMDCCRTTPDSTPAPAIPVHSNVQSIHLLALVPAIAFNTAPDQSLPSARASSPISSAAGPALYARNCALLL